VAVVVAATVAPVPVFLLFLGRQSAKIAMRIAMVFAGPLFVIDDFVVVPDVVVAVIGVIDPVVMMRTGRV
jgi:membrane-associated protease RseP (regulator of RpoE activity)